MNKNVTFEEIPLKVPSFKTFSTKALKLIEELKRTKDAKETLKVIRKMEKLMDDFETKSTVISIRYSLNTVDKKNIKAQDKMDEMIPQLVAILNEWNKVLVKSPFRKELEEKLTPYYFVKIENALLAFDEKIVPELIEENKLSSEYDRILGSAKIEFRGNIYNLSQLGKFATDKDRNMRREASLKIDDFFAEHEKEIGEIYSKLVSLRDTMAKKLGYKNFVELGYRNLGRTDYNADMVKVYREEIAKNFVPVCQKLYKEQAKRIGISFNKMKNYDYNLFYLDGNPKPAGDKDYLVGVATKMYDDMSKESGEFFHLMLNHHLLDLEARAGKAPGGYMTYLPNYEFPFIFSNFNGTKGDVDVLTHEVGHAFQGYLSRKIKPTDFRSPGLETCEIHSMSMEFFAHKYMEGFFKDDANKYRYSHLVDAMEFLPYGITIDEFQHFVYENPNATHEERCAKFKEIESRYTPHKVYDEESKCFSHGGTWLRQSHVFGTPFYYIDYTLAQVCAFQFFIALTKNYEKAWKKYVKLCKCGGKYPFVETLKKNHLQNPFEIGTLEKIVHDLKKILKTMTY